MMMASHSPDQRDRRSRQCLAAASLAFAPATEIPRERALLRYAQFALVHDFAEGRFRESDAIDTITRHGALPELRPHVASGVFRRLLDNHVVLEESGETVPLYVIDPALLARIRGESAAVEASLGRVVGDLFGDRFETAAQQDAVKAEMLGVIACVMERFGNQYAYQMTGRLDSSSAVHRDELLTICQQTLGESPIIGPEDMADAVAEVFASNESHFATFAHSLAETYFFIRLLGLDGGLDLLTENRFDGAQFFIDTNVLVAFLFEESRHHRSILEFLEIALRLGSSVHVTEYTLAEFRRIVEFHSTALAKALDEVPDELVPETRSVWLRAYRRRKKADSEFDVSSFLAEYTNVRETLANNWGVTVEDQPVEHSVEIAEFGKTKTILNEASLAVRHRGKTDAALDHDAHMFYMIGVERERFGAKAAWFLTLDTSLSRAARELQGKEAVPFCMSLDGCLQIMSPYVRSDHRQSFAENFVELVGRNFVSLEQTLRLDDFLMFTDAELSIRALPPEDVKRVIRRVKESFGGEFWRDGDRRRVAYEVQKALSDPTLKYKTTLEREVEERDKQISHLNRLSGEAQSRHDLEMQQLRADLRDERAQRATETVENKNTIETLKRSNRLFRAFALALLALPLAVGVWLVPAEVLLWSGNRYLFCSGISCALAFGWLSLVVRDSVMQRIVVIATILGLLFAASSALWPARDQTRSRDPNPVDTGR